MKKYTLEKVLFFASRDELLHVAKDEPDETDLSQIVKKSVSKGFLKELCSGEKGKFYGITDAGSRTLLKLQIDWRKTRGMSTDDHERKLQRLA